MVGDRAVRRDEADEAEVLAAWSQALPGREPSFSAPRLAGWQADGEGAGMAVLEARETVSDAPIKLAVGVVRVEGAWKVEWGMVIEDDPLPPARQRMAALSELAGLQAATMQGPMVSLLEASYARQKFLPRQRFLALPETAFTCMGSTACCTNAFTIGLDENSRRFVEAVDWAALVPGIEAGPFTEPMPERVHTLVSFRHRLTRDAEGRCKFLTPDNRCAIHALSGRAVFKPCHVFPYRFAWSPDGICVTTNHVCPTARLAKGAPMALQEQELRRRAAVADVLMPDRYHLGPGQEVSWETFRTIEGQLLGLLEGEAPVRQKLWAALRWMDARLKAPDAGVDPAWYDQAPPRLGLVAKLAVARVPKLFDRCFDELKGVPAGAQILPECEAELTRFLRSLLFSKATTYPYGLVAGLNYVVLAYVLLERQVERHARKGISEAFWREYYAVVTNGTFLPFLGIVHRTPATTLAQQAGTPALGLNLLRL